MDTATKSRRDQVLNSASDPLNPDQAARVAERKAQAERYAAITTPGPRDSAGIHRSNNRILGYIAVLLIGGAAVIALAANWRYARLLVPGNYIGDAEDIRLRSR